MITEHRLLPLIFTMTLIAGCAASQGVATEPLQATATPSECVEAPPPGIPLPPLRPLTQRPQATDLVLTRPTQVSGEGLLFARVLSVAQDSAIVQELFDTERRTVGANELWEDTVEVGHILGVPGEEGGQLGVVVERVSPEHFIVDILDPLEGVAVSPTRVRLARDSLRDSRPPDPPRVGATVLAPFDDGSFYYLARVEEVGAEAIEVEFFDGDRGTLASSELRRVDIRVGQRLQAHPAEEWRTAYVAQYVPYHRVFLMLVSERRSVSASQVVVLTP